MGILSRGDAIMGDETNEKAWATFKKERRNLILLSLFLSLYKFVGFSLNQVSMVGNTVPVDNPERMVWIVWGVWGWTLFRYYLYFNRVNDRGFLTTVNRRVSSLCSSELLLKHWGATEEGQRLLEGYASDSCKDPEYKAYVSNSHEETFRINYYVAAQTFSVAEFVSIRPDGSHGDREYTSHHHDNVFGVLDLRNTVRIRLRSVVGAILTETEFSEFYFPATICFLPVAVLLFNLIYC